MAPQPKHIYLIGIKGVGMTGLAALFHDMGYAVEGSDTEEIFFTDRILHELDIPVHSFGAGNITKGIGEAVYSTAYPHCHPEIKAARALGIPMRSYREALADMFNAKKGVLVTGSHGKTTSAAMLGEIFVAAGLDPTVLVGGEVMNWGRTARLGKSEWMIIEGDEYQEKILSLKPDAVLITNVDYDHPDFYKTAEDYYALFQKLIARLPAETPLVVGDNVLEKLGIYGQNIIAHALPFADGDVELSIFGAHNHANARGALAISRALGVDEKIARRALKDFRGTKRRLQYYTNPDADVAVLDDYAHHPTEIRAALSALRERYSQRHITAIFQPHTYSRTERFLDDFARAFGDADSVIILDVYGSAREGKGKVNGKELASAVSKHHKTVEYIATVDDAINILKKRAFPCHSLVITLGAGDVWRIAEGLR